MEESAGFGDHAKELARHIADFIDDFGPHLEPDLRERMSQLEKRLRVMGEQSPDEEARG